MENIFTWLPSVEEVLTSNDLNELAHINRSIQTQAARDILTHWRLEIKDNPEAIRSNFPSKADLKNHVFQETANKAKSLNQMLLHPVVNATGIVLHTNLGRAPLGIAAKKAVMDILDSYCNLEIHMASGSRGSRYHNVESLICQITGAPDCLVVNNNAAAVLLAIETMGKGKEGIISRGQLVEIGGAFRVPEITARGGMTMREIGTTNKTHITDYEQAITEETGLLLVVHPSNFHMTGFVESTPLEQVVSLGMAHNIPTLYDWGCGAIFPLAAMNIGKEQTIKQIMATGVDVVTFSGDKLMGGPQCGIIIGKSEYIAAMKENPLTRAFRVDKMTMAALEGTLRSYSDTVTAAKEIPAIRHLTKSLEELKELADHLMQEILIVKPHWQLSIKEAIGQVGGGSMPDVQLPTYVVTIKSKLNVEKLAQQLRTCQPAVLGYINESQLVLDTRALLPGDIGKIITAIKQVKE